LSATGTIHCEKPDELVMPTIDQPSQIKPLQFGAECADFWRSLQELCGAYRPERHYMRGPGTKWHAKHQWASVECHLSGFDPARVQVTQRISYDGLNAASP
jgi:hypothetical protein